MVKSLWRLHDPARIHAAGHLHDAHPAVRSALRRISGRSTPISRRSLSVEQTPGVEAAGSRARRITSRRSSVGGVARPTRRRRRPSRCAWCRPATCARWASRSCAAAGPPTRTRSTSSWSTKRSRSASCRRRSDRPDDRRIVPQRHDRRHRLRLRLREPRRRRDARAVLPVSALAVRPASRWPCGCRASSCSEVRPLIEEHRSHAAGLSVPEPRSSCWRIRSRRGVSTCSCCRSMRRPRRSWRWSARSGSSRAPCHAAPARRPSASPSARGPPRSSR